MTEKPSDRRLRALSVAIATSLRQWKARSCPPRYCWASIVALVAAMTIGGAAAYHERAAAAEETAIVAGTPKERVVSLAIVVGQSEVVEAPWPVVRVSVTDPGVADTKGLTPEKILVMGKAVGSTDLLMWNRDEELWRAKVTVTADLSQMLRELENLFPGARLKLMQSGETIVVHGLLPRAEYAQQMQRFMESKQVKFVDMTSLAGVQQVQLQVRVAEVSRQALRTLGINAFYLGEDAFIGSTIGSESGGAINPISIGVPAGTLARPNPPFQFTQAVNVSSSVTLFAGFPNQDFQIFLQALAENQYLRLLAEPTLTALSGEDASFLAGGEFPIPVVQSGAVGGSTAISIEYKEFGVRLGFRPTVLGDGTIRLYVAPEVSALSDVGAVVIQGFRVPALVTRRAETTLELKSGQTFGMAGLINRTSTARNSRVPGLGDLPVIGALFRSVRYEQGETELVVMVTASLVEPMSVANPQELPLPGITHRPPDDWELYAMGTTESATRAKLSPLQMKWLKEAGFDRLRGPGAWATYGSRPSPVRTPAASTTQPATIEPKPVQPDGASLRNAPAQ